MGEAELVAADADGVLPPGFYATTNLPTRIRLGGRWLEVENPEMDCALIVRSGEREASAGAGAPGGTSGSDRGWRVRTVPMHRVRTGDLVVVGNDGVRVEAPERPRGATPFEFMTSEVSIEKPKKLLIQQIAAALFSGRAHLANTSGLLVATRASSRRQAVRYSMSRSSSQQRSGARRTRPPVGPGR